MTQLHSELVEGSSWADESYVTVVPWTSSHILYGLPLHQKGNVSKATCYEGPAIYVVHLNRYFCYTSMILFSSHFFVTL